MSKQNNSNAAKLTPLQVAQAHLLHRLRFTTNSIASAFGVCARTIADIIKRRSWQALPQVDVYLPQCTDCASRLRLRSWHRLSDQQRFDIQRYAGAIAEQVEDRGEREALAAALLETWKPRRVVHG